jgi:DNA-binding response OmpR family regulator
MHKLNVLVFGPDNFIATLNELKSYLKFNLCKRSSDIDETVDVLFLHNEAHDDKIPKKLLNNINVIKILTTNKNKVGDFYDAVLKLPTTVDEINSIVEGLAAKKLFSKNSSIKIKKYLLDKNEKKLIKDGAFIVLTEKEIQLLELFLNYKKSIPKSKILASVWRYSSDADTHTVETHIYRLRKKINQKFYDESFILNDKEGYYL